MVHIDKSNKSPEGKEMEEEIFNKEIVGKLMKLKGETRGMNFRVDGKFVVMKKGKEGLKRVEEELEKVGCPVKYDRIKSLNFYPLGLYGASLLAMKKIFGWGDEEFRELGRFTATEPRIIRIYLMYFFSLEAMVGKGPQIWNEYYTIGHVLIPDYSKKEKYLILQIKDFALHSPLCHTLEGYLEMIIKMIVKPKEIKCRETKCTFRGDEYHEFKITWK